ncbi:uncharacterized protein LOC141614002 [Silene latifolia]|uniref:uncharacterized protein LOC141614002 n=1 Tax=Silene latifolia TaxID=37657 RepID=UPI003D77BC95
MKFRFHPLCKSLKLSSLMFADDLLLFSKGDVGSIMILLRTFSTFSHASGLQMSRGKSNVYFNGVASEIRREIVQVSGCIEGKLPFKYLGVPIKPAKLSIKDCQPLIDKVFERIRQLGTKKLSYAGRLVLIKAVYRTLHSYWASIFIIPKAVLLKIEAICRNFLWHGGTEYARTPTVAWSKLCTNQKDGGLGLRDEYSWNKAAVGKLVWWIQAHPSKLWVQWVHAVYLKGQEWEDYNPPQDASWTWKKVCKLKQEFQPAYHQNEWTMVPGKEYTIKKGYSWLRPPTQAVSWSHIVWTKWSIPKHSFIAWLHYQQGFNTKDKLYRLGIVPDKNLTICAQEEESPSHLFFRVNIAENYSESSEWTGVVMSIANTREWWHRRFTRLKIGVLNSILNATMYYIWNQRNASRHENVLLSPGRCVVMIKADIRNRIQQQLQGTVSRKDKHWIEKLLH